MDIRWWLLVVAVLWRTVAPAQHTLTMPLTNGNAAPYWPGAYGILSLQATTNLMQPVIWNDLPNAVNDAGTVTVTNAYPQQFFRAAPVLPVFQFGVFYNVNLEIDPASSMNFAAPVFCNQNIWEGSSSCVFSSSVIAAGTNAAQIVDPFATDFTGSGVSTFLASGQPTSRAPLLSLAGLGADASPAAMRGILSLPPMAYAMGTAAAYSSNGMMYLANEADLVITNFPSGTNTGSATPVGTNLIVYYQNYSLSQLPYDFYLITNGNLHLIYATNHVSSTLLGPNTNIYFAGFSWITNVVFYDWREGWNGGGGPPKSVQAVQIDAGKLNTWLTNYIVDNSGYLSDQLKLAQTGHHIGSVYVYTSVPLKGTQLPAVRVMNGAQLPNPGNAAVPYGFTVATPFPLYVLGNYNSQNNGLSALGLWSTNASALATGNTLPAALMGDSVTILSTNWSDSATNKMPNPGNTTVNAAVLEGIVASNPNRRANYSGGVENALRLLEGWSNDPSGAGNKQTLTYNGSIVVLFYSEYATNTWLPTGNYFNAPTRHWAFDWNFQNTGKLPPLTPAVKNYVSP